MDQQDFIVAVVSEENSSGADDHFLSKQWQTQQGCNWHLQ
jgi:hypothetical protein